MLLAHSGFVVATPIQVYTEGCSCKIVDRYRCSASVGLSFYAVYSIEGEDFDLLRNKHSNSC